MAPVSVLCVIYDLEWFPRNFSTSIENQNYTVFSLWNFLYDPCMISRKSYMVLVWLPRVHTNHIWPSMITKTHIWPSTKSKKVVWSLTRDISSIAEILKNRNSIRIYHQAWHLRVQPMNFIGKGATHEQKSSQFNFFPAVHSLIRINTK